MQRYLIILFFFALSGNIKAQTDSLEIKRIDTLNNFTEEVEIITDEEFIENVLTEYKKSLGGEKKIKKFKNVTIKEQITIDDVIYSIVKYYEYPNKMTKIMSSKGNLIEKIVYNGNKARRWGVKGYKIIEGNELRQLEHESSIFLPLLLDKYRFSLTYDTTETLFGAEAHKISALSQDNDEYVFYFDALNGYILRWIIHSVNQDGEKEVLTIDYNDYREVEGYQFPFEMIYTKAQLPPLRFEVTLVSVNTKLDKDIFIFRENIN